MNLIAATKLGANVIIGYGTSKVVKTIIANNVPTGDMPLHEEAAVTVSSYVIGAYVAGLTEKFVNRKIDDAAELIRKMRNKDVTN